MSRVSSEEVVFVQGYAGLAEGVVDTHEGSIVLLGVLLEAVSV